jgi:hypothetical protein
VNKEYSKEAIAKWYVYSFTFLDDLSFIRSPKEFFKDDCRVYDSFDEPFTDTQIEEIISHVKDRILEAGWEGDGELGVIWIPPFFFEEYTYGEYLWVVKQQNNGIAWLASYRPQPWFEPSDNLEMVLGHENLVEIQNNINALEAMLLGKRNKAISSNQVR